MKQIDSVDLVRQLTHCLQRELGCASGCMASAENDMCICHEAMEKVEEVIKDYMRNQPTPLPSPASKKRFETPFLEKDSGKDTRAVFRELKKNLGRGLVIYLAKK
jgi:hypothetical protein